MKIVVFWMWRRAVRHMAIRGTFCHLQGRCIPSICDMKFSRNVVAGDRDRRCHHREDLISQITQIHILQPGFFRVHLTAFPARRYSYHIISDVCALNLYPGDWNIGPDWEVSWFFLAPPGKCQDIHQIRFWPLLSKSFTLF